MSGRSRWPSAMLVVGAVAALLVRLPLLDHVTLDFVGTGRWYSFLQENGGFAGLDRLEAIYTPPYHYLLVIAGTVFGAVSDVIAIKLITLPFDFVLAGFVYLLVRVKYRSGWFAPAGALAVLFAPTVVLNGSYWGQSDSVYTSGLVATIYLLVVGRPAWAMIAFGLAISFKLQAIFLSPLLLILVLRRQLPWRYTLLVPVPYLALAAPALMVGRSPRETLFVYASQSREFRELTMNAPNLYQWVPNDWYDFAYPFGVAATAVLMLLFVVAVARFKVPLSADRIVIVATASLVVVPFLLPKMHERYFFPADVLAIVLACYFPRLFWVPLAVIGSSLAAYIPFLSTDLGEFVDGQGGWWEPIPLPLVAVVMGIVAVVLIERATRRPTELVLASGGEG